MTGWIPSVRRLLGGATLFAAALAGGSSAAQPVVDGTLSEPYYVSAATAANTNAGFGPDITVREVLYFVDPVTERLYIGLRGKLNTASNDGIGLLLGFSELSGRPAGSAIGGSVPNSGHFLGGAEFAADFDVDYGFAINPGSSATTVYVDAVKYVAGGGAAHYLGSTDQAGTAVAGPSSGTDNSGNPSFFAPNAVAFAFNNAGTPDTGFEFSIPFADLGITGEEALALAPSSFQAFAFVVSSTGYFSDVTVPGNVTTGNSGFRPNYSTNQTASDCSCSSPSTTIGNGPYNSGAESLELVAPTYSVTAPAAGLLLEAGARFRVRWNGAGVPDRDDDVDIRLGRVVNGVHFTSVKLELRRTNNGRFKVTLPADLEPGSNYQFVVSRSDDPSVYGVSELFTVYSGTSQFVFTEPDGGETWQRGTTKTIGWTTPETAPEGTVTVRWYRGSGVLLEAYPDEADDGSLDVAVPANLTTGDFYFTIVSDADPAFFGQSNTFSIQRFEATSPVEDATWQASSAQTVSWTSGANAGGQLRVALRSRTSSYTAVLSGFGPYTDFSRTVTIPPSTPVGEYEIQLLHRYTPPGGVEVRTFVYSNAFLVTGFVAPEAPPARHFASPMAAEGSPETMLVVTGLADGTEVGAFASLADGTSVLLASGVVEGGEAVFAVPSDIVDGTGAGSSELSFGGSPALVLRTYASGVEETLETAARLSEGEVVVVEASKGAVAADASVSLATVVPNPTSGASSVRFALASSELVTVTVHDALGRVVSTVYEGVAPSGATSVALPSSLPAGVYVVRIAGGSTSSSARFTVIR